MRKFLVLTVALGVGGFWGCGRHAERLRLLGGPVRLRAWDREAVEKIVSDPENYEGRTLRVELAFMDPRKPLRISSRTCSIPLRGGGVAVAPLGAVPRWLRQWTPAPLRLTARLLPQPAENLSGQRRLVLRLEHIALAHPLELACLEIERRDDGTWLVAWFENLGGETAGASLRVRLGGVALRRKVPPVKPGESARVEVMVCGKAEPRWSELPASRRRLEVTFDDRSRLTLDLAPWLEATPTSVLDLGYTYQPPANAVLVLSQPGAELERFAGLELVSYLSKLTDANIEPREPEGVAVPGGLPILVVGTPRANQLAARLVERAALGPRLAALGDEGYLLKSLTMDGKPALLVTGRTPRGVMRGVYRLLERYGVWFSLSGTRFPPRGKFRLLDVDETGKPLVGRRALVLSGEETTASARLTQWEWLGAIDLAAKVGFNEVVVPLNGLEQTFDYGPGLARGGVFPFEVGAYECLAQARVAHQRALGIIADYARRRGISLAFARWSADGTLRRVRGPRSLNRNTTVANVGRKIHLLSDPGDLLGLPRVEETAGRLAKLLANGAEEVALPLRQGAAARVTYAGLRLWRPRLSPEEFYGRWAATLCQGQAAENLAAAVQEADKLDEQVLAAAPRPFGLGVPLVVPVERGHPESDWRALAKWASGRQPTARAKALGEQAARLRALQRKLDPLHERFREALGAVAAAWEAPLGGGEPAQSRAERISERIYMFRALLGAFASVQEGALAYYAGLREPEEALPKLRIASRKIRKARRIMLWVARRLDSHDLVPILETTAERLAEAAGVLGEWLGPAAEGEPVARLALAGSDAIVHLFRTRESDIYALYRLSGQAVVQVRLNATEARLFRRGEPPRKLEAEGGLFLVAVDRVPTYLVVRSAAWPGTRIP